jgi:hypothetical protein
MAIQIRIQRQAEWRYTYQVVLRIYAYNPKATDINDLYPQRFRRVVGTFDSRESAQTWLRYAYKMAQDKRLTGRSRNIRKIMDRGKNAFAVSTTGGNEWVWEIRAKKEERI